MKLYATPLSHYSRKVRLVLDYLRIPYESIDVGNVAEGTMEKFGRNPLSRIPVLEEGENWLIESDHIAAYLVRKFDPKDSLGVLTSDPFELNARAVLNGIMAEEVCVILAKRMAVPIEKFAFFDRSFTAVENGFAWLEDNGSRFRSQHPRYLDLHLLCLWEHIEYYNLVPLGAYRSLREVTVNLAASPWIRKSAPYVLKPKV